MNLAALVLILVGGIRSVPVPAAQLPDATVRLPGGRDSVEVPFEEYRRWITVAVRVNGSQPLRFVVDSGAPGNATILADEELARTLPLEIVGRARVEGADQGDAVSVPLAGGVRLEIGEVAVEDAFLAIGVAGEALAGADGIIGGALLDHLVVEVDHARQRLRLHRPGSWEPPGTATALPLERLERGQLAVPARVGIEETAPVDVSLAVDTGALHALSLEPGSRPGLELPVEAVRDIFIGYGATGPIRGALGRVTGLFLAGHRLDDVVTTFAPESTWTRLGEIDGVPLNGNVGMRVLRKFRVTFDVPGGNLWLNPGDDFDAPIGFNTVGFFPLPWAPGDPAVVLADVAPGSPAAAAGLRAGDELVAVEGRPVAEIPVQELEAMIEGEPGVELVLTVRREGEELEARLVRDRWL